MRIWTYHDHLNSYQDLNLPWPVIHFINIWSYHDHFYNISGSELTVTIFIIYQELNLPFMTFMCWCAPSAGAFWNLWKYKLTMTIFTLYKDLILPWPFLHNIRIQQNLLFVSFIWRLLTPNYMYIWERKLWWLGC